METKVLTPKGFRLLGDIAVGQQVCNPDGTVARVVAVHERGVQEFFRVTLGDGATVEASADHLWTISIAGTRHRRKTAPPVVPEGLRPEDEWNLRVMQRCIVVTTRELAILVGLAAEDAAKGQRPHYVQIPLTAPVAMTGAPGRWPLLPAYTLGVLVGDGCLTDRSVTFSSADPGIAERVRAELPNHLHLQPGANRNGCIAYRISGGIGTKGDTSPQAYLRREGLFGCGAHEKFVPERIKIAPVETRRAFVQGLFDTDGYMDDRGHVEFVTVSERLASDVRWLLRSLGCRATLTTKRPHYSHQGERRQGRLAYRLYVQGADLGALFGLERKAARAAKFNGGGVWPSHRVVSVTPSGRDQARCITVDNPNGLYITDDFIVTHNSSALLMAALQYVDVPGYAAYVFRRTFADLAKPGALIPRSHEWLAGTDASWRGDSKSWHFPSGASLTFGYLEHENDKFNYQGTEVQFVGFDETTQFSEGQYRYLFSRLRKPKGSDIPIRARGATNPGGTGHEWVRQRFLVEGPGHGRVFVPARLEDNPHLDQEDYEESLANLDPVTRAQLRNGDWEIRENGPLFDRAWFEIVDSAPAGVRWLRWWDMAATEKKAGKDPDWTAGARVGTKDGVFYIRDVRRRREKPLAIEQLVRATAEEDGRDVEIWMEQEPGSSGVTVIDHYARKVLAGWSFYGQHSTGDKISYAKPLSAAAQKGNVKLVRGPWITDFLDELEVFPRTGVHDDQVDAVSKAHAKLAETPELSWI